MQRRNISSATILFVTVFIINILLSGAISDVACAFSYPFSDDMENPASGNWNFDAPWGYTTSASHSGSYSITDSPDGPYANNTEVSATLSDGIDFSTAAMPVLTFWHSCLLEPSADFGHVDVSIDGGTSWQTLWSTTGFESTWNMERVNLWPYAGESDVRIRFRLISNASGRYDGWYIDDVSIDEDGVVSYPFCDDMESGMGSWFFDSPWGQTTAQYHSASTSWTDSPAGMYANNTDVSLWLIIDMSPAVMPVLSFWQRYGLEENKDYGVVEVSRDGASWDRLSFVTGISDWREEKVDLAEYAAEPNLRVRFRLITNASGTADGWYIDDVCIGETTTPAIGFPFCDDMEDPAAEDNWHSSSWERITSDSHSPTHSCTDSPEGNYVFNIRTAFTLANNVDLTGAVNPRLTFWHRYAIYNGSSYYGIDYGRVQVSTYNGQQGTYDTVATYTGTQSEWAPVQIDLSDYTGLQVRIRFLLRDNSGPGGNYVADGWYIDDVCIRGDEEPPTVVTRPAEDITDTSATLNGELTDLGTASSVDVSFEYGTDKGGPYPLKTDPQTMAATGLFSEFVSGLLPNTTYYFRAKAVGDGTSYGDELEFLPVQVQGWFITLTTTSTDLSIDPQNRIASARPDATDGFDPGIDIPAPPLPPPPIDLDTYFEGTDPLFPRLSHDERQEVLPHDLFDKTWTLHAYSDTDPFNIGWDISGLPDDLSATITRVSPACGPCLNMRSQSSFDETFDNGVQYVFEIHISQSVTLVIDLFAGWNMISSPGDPLTSDVASLLVPPMLPLAYTWDPDIRSYIMVTRIKFGSGYWVATTEDTTLTLEYLPRTIMERDVKAGWNMTGSIDCVCPVDGITSEPPDSILTNAIYTWDTSIQNYNIVAEIVQGEGYWTAAITDCVMSMSCVASPMAQSGELADVASPTWKSAVSVESQDQQQKLLFGMHPSASDGFDRLLDKPVPPFPEASGEMKKRGGKELSGILKAAWLIPDTTFPMLRESYVKEGTQGKWELSVELPRPGKIEWSDLPEGYRCMIHYDKRSIDMHTRKFLPLPAGEYSLTLVLDAFDSLPERTQLLANYPNPFNPETWIPYELKEDGNVEIRIYSATGQLVRVLNLGHRPAGFYIAKDKAAYWDGKNEAGEQVASGIYFYTIQAGGFTATKKMVIAR